MDGEASNDYFVSKVRFFLKARPKTAERKLEFALAQALSNLDLRNIKVCLRLLEYAQRIAPSDMNISFAIGVVRIATGDPRATEPLELVARRTEWRDAIVHLASARYCFGNADGAAAELHRTLQINAPGSDFEFMNFANTLADVTGAFGWCGLDNAGRITLGGAVVEQDIESVSVRLDGKPAAFRTGRPRRGRVRTLILKAGWQKARRITVTVKRRPLIGSPIDVQKVTRVEGFVSSSANGIEGWCWLPGEREHAPRIEVYNSRTPKRRVSKVARELYRGGGQFADFASPRAFSFSLEELDEIEGPLSVCSMHGRPLYGAPVDPRQTLESARRSVAGLAKLFPANGASSQLSLDIIHEPSIPVGTVVQRPVHPVPRLPLPVDIVIPVYRGLKVTIACIESVIAARSIPDERIVVVVDASPEPELISALNILAGKGLITLRVETVNKGFPATANIGLRMTEGHDVILLNSDTLVPEGWVASLQAAAYADNDIGSATPLSNDATIFSYPLPDAANPPPSLKDVRSLSAMAAEVNGSDIVDVPTGHGFCMYLRRECLDEVGVFREDIFGQGYGEENDLCMRAKVFGWRHVAVPGLFVGHVGTQSFANAKVHLTRRNGEIINRIHVGYDRMIQEWLARDPLAPHRRRMDIARFQTARAGRPTVAFITHDRSGGVKRHVAERALARESDTSCTIILRPRQEASGRRWCEIESSGLEAFPNLSFALPDEAEALREFMLAAEISEIEFHHFIGHDPSIFDLVTSLDVPYSVHLHDYAWFCPRSTLTNGANRYCGEPNLDACTDCITDHGSNIDEQISPRDLRERSTAFLSTAQRVVAPSSDTARRFKWQLGIAATPEPWEQVETLRLRLAGSSRRTLRRVCVVGAIGYEKGYSILLDLARLASKKALPLEIAIVGFTCDDQRLLETGHVTITGRYEENEVIDLIRAQDADFGFLPALCPETWSYTLTQIWQANLPVIAFDIGAPAERLRERNAGTVLPLHIPTEKLASVFIHPDLFRNRAAGRVGKKDASDPGAPRHAHNDL